jgi:hypothetical protein
MMTPGQFHIYYFHGKLKEIDFQLRELEAAPEADRLNHTKYVSELLHSCMDEFNHVELYNEVSHWPVHEACENYIRQINEIN